MAGNNEANVPDWVNEAETMGGNPFADPAAAEKREEITLKFAKGLVGEPFMSRNGKELVRIKIPNADRSDRTPWAEFVLPKKAVHENQYSKGMWAKLPADGHTTVSRPKLIGREDGQNIWETERKVVSNQQLKEMVEFYKKEREPHEKGSSGREPSSPDDDKEADLKDPEKPPFGKDISELPGIKKQLEAGKKEAEKNAEKNAEKKTAEKTKTPKQKKETVR